MKGMKNEIDNNGTTLINRGERIMCPKNGHSANSVVNQTKMHVVPNATVAPCVMAAHQKTETNRGRPINGFGALDCEFL